MTQLTPFVLPLMLRSYPLYPTPAVVLHCSGAALPTPRAHAPSRRRRTDIALSTITLMFVAHQKSMATRCTFLRGPAAYFSPVMLRCARSQPPFGMALLSAALVMCVSSTSTSTAPLESVAAPTQGLLSNVFGDHMVRVRETACRAHTHSCSHAAMHSSSCSHCIAALHGRASRAQASLQLQPLATISVVH
jgi:hypothetical protein